MGVQVTVWAVTADARSAAQALLDWLKELGVDAHALRVCEEDEVTARCAAPLEGPTLWVGDCGVRGRVPQAVAASVEEPLPGLESLVYPLWFARLGAAAMRYRVSGGWRDGHLSVALPAQFDAAKDVVEQLLMPEWIHHYASSGASDSAGPSSIDTAPPLSSPVQVESLESEPTQAPSAQSGQGAWQRALHAAGGALDRSTPQGIPDEWASFSPLANVLHQAGEHASVVMPSGRRFGLWGFPDLQRPGSRVLAVGEGKAWPEVIALHRHPVRVGTCVVDEEAWFGSEPLTLEQACEDGVGGLAPKEGGACFATDAQAVYLLRSDKVWCWDGRREREEGTARQVLASLVLRWSNR